MTRIRKAVVIRRLAAIKERLITVLEDDPGDLARRICRRCGAPVRSYLLRPKSRAGAGGELIQCACGHWIGADGKGWKVVRNE